MDGKATFTTDPSMNDRLDAHIVAASTQPGWAVVPPGRAEAEASSQAVGVPVILAIPSI